MATYRVLIEGHVIDVNADRVAVEDGMTKFYEADGSAESGSTLVAQFGGGSFWEADSEQGPPQADPTTEAVDQPVE